MHRDPTATINPVAAGCTRPKAERPAPTVSPAESYEGAVVPMPQGGVDFGPVAVLTVEGGFRPLRHRLDLANHSPDGLSWGYAGSGPAQLALALCADLIGDDALALRISRTRPVCNLVASWSRHEGWTISREALLAHVMAGAESLGEVVR